MMEENNINKVEKPCQLISESIQANAKKHFKVKEVIVRPNYSKWITKEVILQSKACARARNKYRKNPVHIQHNYDSWKKEEKKLTDLTKSTKRDFEQGKANKVLTRKDFDKLDNQAKKDNPKEIAFIKDINGVIPNSPEQALKNLCDIHFPTAIETNRDVIDSAHDRYNNKYIPRKKHDWINPERIKLAIEKFQNGKAPGTDNIPPDLLKDLGPIMTEEIRILFNDCITAEYTPTIWRQSKVIFIPKSGKADYTIAKAYRPISLTPFLFKTLERLCFWHAHETALKDLPIHERQYAYKQGQGTETAISRALDEIEKGMLRRQFAVGTFCDIA